MLKRHKRYEHAGSIQFCQICRAKFEYPLPYASHLATHAPEGKEAVEAKCPICGDMIEFPVSDPKAFETHALECALDDRRNNTQKWKARYPITPCEKCGRVSVFDFSHPNSSPFSVSRFRVQSEF